MSNVVRMPKRHAYLYIMASNGFIKVGVSKNPFSRIKQIKTGSPNHVKIAFMARFDACPYPLEREIHSLLSRFHVRLEWFNMGDEFGPSIVELIINIAYMKYEMAALEVKSDYYAFHAHDGLTSSDEYLADGFPHMVSQALYEDTFPNGEDIA